MHELALTCHPTSETDVVTQITAKIARHRSGALVLSYVVNGRISDVSIPARAAAERTDGLWRHTCFEAFVGSGSNPAYYELNFSPSSQWAAYRFSDYRDGMREAMEVDSPLIDVNSNSDRYTLHASLPVGCLSVLPRTPLWRLGLSAVIEDKSGRKSYWALLHPPGKPDFHDARCRSYEFSPAEQA